MLGVLGGVVVVVGLFLDWYGDLTAWEAFELADVVLAAVAGVAIVTGLTGGLDGRALPWAGGALLAIVASQLIELPPAIGGDPAIELGAWLALAGAGIVLAGGALRVADVSVSVTVAGRGSPGRVAAVDRRPVPAAPAATPAAEPPRTESFPAATEP
jgi:hypothetical protein